MTLVIAGVTPCSSITPPGQWEVMAHVLRYYTYHGQHPSPDDYYNEECIRWLESTWREEWEQGYWPQSCTDDHDDHEILTVAKDIVDVHYCDWDLHGAWREWWSPTWETIICGLRVATEQGDADTARMWLGEIGGDIFTDD
jgi:hypothetical protein